MDAHTRVQELIAAYAIDALPEDEAREASRELLDHLAACEGCQYLYGQMRETSADLALAADPVPVSVSLRARVMEVTREDTAQPVPAPAPPRLRRLLAASVAAALALGGMSAFLGAQLNEVRGERERARQVLAFINEPSTTVTTMRAARGAGRMTLAVQGDGRALLIGSDLELPPERVFEIWLVRGAKVVPAGVFVDDGGTAVVELRVDPDRDLGVAITIERERVEQPTSEPVFQGALSA